MTAQLTSIIFVLANVLVTPCFAAQMLTWDAPTTNTNGTPLNMNIVKGYRIGYEILAENDPCQAPNRPIRYWVDVGNITSMDLHEDPNFQIGVRYFFTVIAYTDRPESNIWGVVQSEASNAACKTIRGAPKVELDQEDGDEHSTSNYKRTDRSDDEDEVIALGSVFAGESDTPLDDPNDSEDNKIAANQGALATRSKKTDLVQNRNKSSNTEYVSIGQNKVKSAKKIELKDSLAVVPNNKQYFRKQSDAATSITIESYKKISSSRLKIFIFSLVSTLLLFFFLTNYDLIFDTKKR
ncbi:MAG: hypothetical protein A2Z20_10965 [Bdellovibrionales bacterium RBG_16_40_8]|nr:MAG: hypothetical protein A2Z20_10965 [Bdellovibrionales bacterium RBG_16_40_8]